MKRLRCVYITMGATCSRQFDYRDCSDRVGAGSNNSDYSDCIHTNESCCENCNFGMVIDAAIMEAAETPDATNDIHLRQCRAAV